MSPHISGSLLSMKINEIFWDEQLLRESMKSARSIRAYVVSEVHYTYEDFLSAS